MTLLSSTFRAELEKAVSRPGILKVHAILEIDLPDQTVVLSQEGVSFSGASPLIKRWESSPKFGISVGDYTLQSTGVSVVVTSPVDNKEPLRLWFDNAFAKFHAGLRRSAVRIKLYSPNLASTDTITWFVGVLQSWSRTGEFEWTLNITVDDLPMRNGYITRVPFTKGTYPSGDPDIFNKMIPVIYGVHSAASLTGKGMVPAYCTDTTAFIYTVAIGKVTVQAAYKIVAGVTTALGGGDYSVVYSTRGGVLTTTLDLVANPGTDAVITADVSGLTYNSDGTGGIIKSPTDQLKHALANFIYNDWRQGPFYGDANAPIETTMFGTVGAFLATQGHEGSAWYAGDNETRVAGDQMMNEWLETHGCHALWTHAGQLGLVVIDHNLRTLSSSTSWLIVQSQGGTPLTMEYSADEATREINVSYIFSGFTGDYEQSLSVVDSVVPENITRDVQMAWSAAHG